MITWMASIPGDGDGRWCDRGPIFPPVGDIAWECRRPNGFPITRYDQRDRLALGVHALPLAERDLARQWHRH
jgi:hypothetical protein